MTVTVEMVLDNLEGWTLYVAPNPDEDPELKELKNGTVNTITTEEVSRFIVKGTKQVAAYLELRSTSDLSLSDTIEEAISSWAAGLLYNKKINTEAPNYEEDQKGLSYGDKLINSAKALLKPYTLDEDNDGKSDSYPTAVVSIQTQ
jgi:hypothetical protein